MNKALLLTLTLITFGGLLNCQAEPLEITTAQSIAGTKKLYEAIVGTVWLHHYKGNDFEFAFGKSGLIEKHTNWKGIKWRVVSPTEVIFDGTTGAKMLFTFDKDAKTFTNIDWDGTPTTGTIASQKK